VRTLNDIIADKSLREPGDFLAVIAMLFAVGRCQHISTLCERERKKKGGCLRGVLNIKRKISVVVPVYEFERVGGVGAV
jgi:hypothetical protein